MSRSHRNGAILRVIRPHLPLAATFVRPQVCRARVPRPVRAHSGDAPSGDMQSGSPREAARRHYEIGPLWEASDLLGMLSQHTRGPLRPWALQLTTALEFFAELDAAVYDTLGSPDAAGAVRDAIASAQGVRALMDAFDEWLIDEPEALSLILQRVDAAFGRRLRDLGQLQRRSGRVRPQLVAPRDPPAGLWARLRQQMDQNVEWRSGPPPHDPNERGKRLDLP